MLGDLFRKQEERKNWSRFFFFSNCKDRGLMLSFGVGRQQYQWEVKVYQRRQPKKKNIYIYIYINIKRIRSKGKKGFRGSVGGSFEMERKWNFVVSVWTWVFKCKWASFLFYLEYIRPKTKARAWENSGDISMRRGRMSNIGGAQLFFPHTLMDFFFFFFFVQRPGSP